MTTRLLTLALAVCLGCSDPAPEPSDGGVDAGTSVPEAQPMPLARIDDGASGLSHAVSFQGTVTEHGPARENPFEAEGITPARLLQVRPVDGDPVRLFYTLPRPYAFAAYPNDQLRGLYRERAGGTGSSHGVRLTSYTDQLIVQFEDGTRGLALEDDERSGFSFALDLQPVSEEPDDCGRKVRYPMLVTNGARTKRLFPGQSETFPLPGGQDTTLVLLDSWRIEDARCSDLPEFSVGYIVLPR